MKDHCDQLAYCMDVTKQVHALLSAAYVLAGYTAINEEQKQALLVLAFDLLESVNCSLLEVKQATH